MEKRKLEKYCHPNICDVTDNDIQACLSLLKLA